MEKYLTKLLEAKTAVEVDFILHEVTDDVELDLGEYMMLSSLAKEIRSKF